MGSGRDRGQCAETWDLVPVSQVGGNGIMRKVKTLRRWTVKALGLLLLLSAIFLGGAARAQTPAAAKAPPITYTKNTVFHLPVQMDERTRAGLREVCLYVKAGSTEW